MPGVIITGVWLRTVKEQHDGFGEMHSYETTDIEVLVEINGTWRKVIEETDSIGSGPISHIAETGGIVKAPLDTLHSSR